MSLTKAELIVEGNKTIPCMFNPEQLTLSKSVSWKNEALPGRDEPQLVFVGANDGTLSMDLWFDTTDTGKPVTEFTDQLFDLMKVDKDNSKTYDKKRNQGRPPFVRFHWGNFTSFDAIVESLSLTFTYFSADGVPLRAKAAGFTLKQVNPSDYKPQNPTSGTPYPQRVHTLLPGETLDRIAAAYYGDASRWRLIAAANAIEDPMALVPGSAIVIPEPGEAFDD
jgi:hypothetical protein